MSETDIQIAPGVTIPLAVLEFSFARSGGPGGQNVNKLNTKATLSVRLEDLAGYMDAPAVGRLARLAAGKITSDDRLVLQCEESRSQHANKATCIEKLRDLIVQALVRPKHRRKTKPSRGAKERRLQSKKQRGQIKEGRRGRFE